MIRCRLFQMYSQQEEIMAKIHYKILLFFFVNTNFSVLIQLRREAAILSHLDHPNIVQYLGSSEDKDYIRILLERASKGNSFHVLVLGIHSKFILFKAVIFCLTILYR